MIQWSSMLFDIKFQEIYEHTTMHIPKHAQQQHEKQQKIQRHFYLEKHRDLDTYMNHILYAFTSFLFLQITIMSISMFHFDEFLLSTVPNSRI